MSRIELCTRIKAPTERCFDLARSIDLHMESIRHTGEKAIAGRTSGLMGLGEYVTWRAKHFGVWQKLTSKITAFDAPNSFTDEMIKGTFKSFKHQHHFSFHDGETLMTDIFVFESPFGIIGKLVNTLFLKKYMTNLLTTRNEVIKLAAESK